MALDKKKTLLLVEDESVIAMIEKKQLEDAGYRVIHTATGEKALTLVSVEKEPIDMVLMDIDLGKGMEGTETAKKILAEHDLPLIFLTSHAAGPMVEKTENIRNYGYIVKSSNFIVLSAAIKTAFRLFEEKQLAVDQKKEFEEIGAIRKVVNQLSFEQSLTHTIQDLVALVVKQLKQVTGAVLSVVSEYDENKKSLIIRKLDADKEILKKVIQAVGEKFLAVETPVSEKMYEEIKSTQYKIVDTLYEATQGAVPKTISSIIQKIAGIKSLVGLSYLFNDEVYGTSMLGFKSNQAKPSIVFLMEYARLTANSLQRVKAEDAQRESESFFRDAQQAAKIGTYKLNFITGLWESSEVLDTIFGIDFSYERTIEGWLDLIHPDDREMMKTYFFDDICRRKAAFNKEYRVIRKSDGAHIWVLGLGSSSFDEDGRVCSLMGIIQDITERKNSQKLLYESEEKYRQLFEIMAQGVFYQDADGPLLDINPAGLELFGLTKDQFLSRTSLHPEWKVVDEQYTALPPEKHPSMIALETGSAMEKTVGVYNPKRHDYRWLQVDAKPQFRHGETKPYQVIVTMNDITKRKLAEVEIEKLLAEKEIILREVHHRIKNNLNTIKALLSLQSDSNSASDAAGILRDAAGRIQTMRVLYDKLYLSDTFSQLSIKDYLTTLIDQIVSIFPRHEDIKVHSEIEDMTMNVKTLSPLGIIINEFITNSMKYAFPNRTNGKISIRIAKTGKTLVLEYRDNGVGLPESVSFEKSDGFGIQLIKLLVQQIRGSIKIERGSGTKFVIEFEV